MVLVEKNLPANAGATGDSGLIPESGRSPGRGHDNPLQYSCLENPMNRGTYQAGVSMGYLSQEYWSGHLFPPPGDLPDSGIKPTSLASPALAGRFFITVPPEKPLIIREM